jgi:DTW domain-containing protein YfiP
MRENCPRCLRTKAACYCEHIHEVNNHTQLVILQHPSEQKHPLNTGRIAHLSFKNSYLWKGENFSHHEELNRLIGQGDCFLLFPGEKASTIGNDIKTQIKTLILLDGTWKKAKKIFYLSSNLQQLPRLQLKSGITSRYRIRKEPKSHYLSTLEAAAYALGQLEDTDFSPVFRPFDTMIDYQIKKMGKEVFQKNYKETL